MEITVIDIARFTLHWTDWYNWEDFYRDLRNDPNAIAIPDSPGVYEAKLETSEKRLTIGKANNLRMRVKQGLVKGLVPHSAGNRIRNNEVLSGVQIRWAVTDRPSCAEEELHKMYILEHGEYPKYTMHT